MQQARRKSPGARQAAIVTIEGDQAVDNGQVEDLARLWEKAGRPVAIERCRFAKELGLNHDIVDPEQVGADPAVTYPVLTRLIGPRGDLP